MRWILLVLLTVLARPVMAASLSDVQLMTVQGHPIQYYLSLPQGWTANKSWPVLVSSEASEKQFKANAEEFAAARGARPFIIVVPITLTTSASGYRTDLFPYSAATWDAIEKGNTCEFSLGGLKHILNEVGQKFHGDGPLFLTGLEAGTHLLWASVFTMPGKFTAATAVAGNYRGRCLAAKDFQANSAHSKTHIRQLVGSLDDPFWRNNTQWEEVKGLAQRAGMQDLSSTEVAGAGHVRMAKESLDYFSQFLR